MFFYTSFRMQLAVDVQIPDEFGGLNGEAIYIGITRYFPLTRGHSLCHIPGDVEVQTID